MTCSVERAYLLTRRSLLASVTLVALASSLSVLIFAPTSSAAVTGFNPGKIIDDSVFANKSSMTATQIQLFLNSKVPNCDTYGTKPSEFGGGTRAQYAATKGVYPPFTCLKDYTENGSSAAQIIYDAAQEFSINPQVLIVLLQKEQGLVTDEWPFPVQYQKATGYGCPDTAPCDSQYYGLTNQLRWAAKMFRSIMNNSSSWYTPYILGDNFVQWSPNSSCGGSTVNIQNRATQALYNYTPYQPNAAALNAGYGTGDDCSAYGNRNFYLYFSDWFGSTTGPDYAASFKSSGLYSNSSMTTAIPLVNGKYITTPSQTLYAKVEATNTGRAEWSSYASLGTANPRDRMSAFKSSGWLNDQRVAHPTDIPVKAVEVGLFTFTLSVPAQTGSYNEGFSIVEDGKAWTSDVLNLAIDVSNPQPYSPSYTGHILDSAGRNTLYGGDQLLSPDLYTAFALRKDGHLSLRKDFAEVWSPPAAGVGSYLSLQPDGNLVLYASSGAAVWNSGTYGKGASKLYVQEDGNLVIYNSQGVTWSSGTNYSTSHINFTTSKMPVESVLYPGQGIQTADRKYSLYLQGDGNLVLYSPYRALWASNTVGSNAATLVIQADGNAVLYNKNGAPVWNSGTVGRGPSSLNVQQDGNLVLYNASGATWSTRTDGKQ